MTGDAGARFRLTRFRPGYSIADVDPLIARIEETLQGRSAPGNAITAAEVRAARFRTVRLTAGYDEKAVDEALEFYAAQLDAFSP